MTDVYHIISNVPPYDGTVGVQKNQEMYDTLGLLDECQGCPSEIEPCRLKVK